MGDWSRLPYDLIVSIANKLLDVGDFVMLSSVCHNWHLVYKNKAWKPRHRIPWLMLNECYDHEHNVIKRQFCSPSTFKIYRLPLPEASGSKCWGTSHGWIVAFNQDFSVRLLDPISRASIDLPPNSMLRNNDDWFSAIQKAIVLKLHDKFVVMIIYKHNRALAFSRDGDNDWTSVNFPFPVDLLHVVCVEDEIFAITMLGTLMLIDIDGPDEPTADFVASPPEDEEGWLNIYLVEAEDNLLLVFFYEHDIFRVYVLDSFEEEWIPLEEFGDTVLLVDDYGCISVPGYGYLKGSRIYFVEDNSSSLLDLQGPQMVYLTVNNVKDYSSEIFWICDGSPLYNCPVWMVPKLW